MFGNMLGGNQDMNSQVTELIEKLKQNANLNDEQAQKVIETIKNFIVEKYPMLQGAINNMLGGNK